MQRLQKAYDNWKSFVSEREEARSQAIGFVDRDKEALLVNKQAQLAKLKAEVALLKAELAMSKTTYHKTNFDAQWALDKSRRREELDEAIAEELATGKTPYQLCVGVGSKNVNMFYEVARAQGAFREEQAQEALNVDWKWSRFTGTQRYALGNALAQWELELLGEDDHWTYVLMKGTVDTPLEGQECLWDYESGAFISGSREVYESDNDANRRKRADTLADVLGGRFKGKLKETPNPYFETVDD